MLPTTPRLLLRCFTPGDLDFVARLYADPEVTRYLGGPKTRAQVEDLMRTRILEYYAAHPGLGIWATVERATGALVGMHLINHIQGEDLLQVGYILAPEFWGRGYATEMTRAVLRYGFADLALPRIHAITDVENVASQRVLLNAGLHRHGERSFPHPAYAGHAPFAFFQRDAEEWLAE